MRQCAYCGHDFEPGRSDQLYCCANHRTYASRKRQRQAAQQLAEERRQAAEQLRTRQKADYERQLDQLRGFAPMIAKAFEALISTQGLDCLEPATRLCVAAFHEGRAVQRLSA